MQRSLFLLVLMGQCFFFTCHIHVYHFIETNKTWDEARTYCREKYTDLAAVSHMTDMKRLTDSTQSQGEAWIGLTSYPGKDNRTWHWSLPGVDLNINKAEWDNGEPNDNQNHLENCALMMNNKLHDFVCTESKKFICYNETNQDKKTCHLIEYSMTWPQAQKYCRVNHTDLISGLDQLHSCDQSVSEVWIGLFRDTWMWSDGSNSSFRYWESLSNNDMVDGQSNKTCAMTVLKSSGRWSFDYCSNKKPFICYDDKVILIKQQKTWSEALQYCRENYHDLVSITNSNIQTWVQERMKTADTTHVWIGLRYTCTLDLWFWVSDELLCYDNWGSNDNTNLCGHAAAMKPTQPYKWFEMDCTNKFNFICSTSSAPLQH